MGSKTNKRRTRRVTRRPLHLAVNSMQRVLRDPNTNLPLMVQHGYGRIYHSEPGVVSLALPRMTKRRHRRYRR